MTNVVQFPTQPRVQLFLAEEYARDQIRQELGACMGILHSTISYEGIEEVAQRMKRVAGILESIIGVREACK